MNGQIIVDVTRSDDGTYQFAIQHPKGTRLDEVAGVLSIVTRNLRRRAEEQAAEEMAK